MGKNREAAQLIHLYYSDYVSTGAKDYDQTLLKTSLDLIAMGYDVTQLVKLLAFDEQSTFSQEMDEMNEISNGLFFYMICCQIASSTYNKSFFNAYQLSNDVKTQLHDVIMKIKQSKR